MENNINLKDTLVADVLALGATKASVISVHEIKTDAAFREMCASNACGVYGKCWMCPPEIGEITELMAEIRTYDFALVYQLIGTLEDSFDFEGMQEAGDKMNTLSQELRRTCAERGLKDPLHLGAGGCRVCPVCAKRTDEPCRFPDLAMSSLEAYGINVSLLAASANMKYINGQNTVTYFGAVFFRDET